MAPKRKLQAQAGPAQKKKQKTHSGLKRHSTDVRSRRTLTEHATAWRARSKFMSVQLLPALDLGDLDRSPYAIFRPENFPDVDYDLIKPSARLATLLLEQGLNTLNTIVNRKDELFSIGEWDSDERWKMSYSQRDSDPDRPVTTEERELITQALGRLTFMVSFEKDPELGFHGDNEPLYKDPRRGKSPLFPDIDEIPSRVTYGQALLDDLRRSTRRGDIAAMLVLRTQFAVLLAHETVHALVSICNGDDDSEPLFYKALVGEVGFEFEQRLFGGVLQRMLDNDIKQEFRKHRYANGKLSSLNGVPVLEDWPNHRGLTVYKDCEMRVRDGTRDVIPRYDIAWRVPVTYFQKLFTKAFWEGTNEERVEGLRPSKTLGYVFDGNPKLKKNQDFRYRPQSESTKITHEVYRNDEQYQVEDTGDVVRIDPKGSDSSDERAGSAMIVPVTSY